MTFTNEEDQYAALMDVPWLIYNHYLSVKECKQNFSPIIDAIKQTAVWVHVSGFPIEYYDARVVDKNTLSKERVKYVRLCMQVDLRKSLFVIFTIKGSIYKIEYEGLHLLCLICGCFGHYKNGCKNETGIKGY